MFVYRKAINIIDERFVSYAADKQDFLGDEEKQKKVMGLVTDENILVHIKRLFVYLLSLLGHSIFNLLSIL